MSFGLYVSWDPVPLFCHSDGEQIPSNFKSAMLHPNVQGVGCPRVALAASPAIVNHSAGSTWSFPVRTLYTMAIQILTTGMGKCHEYWCWCVWPLCISKLKVYFFRLGRGNDGVGQSSTVQMLSKSPTKVPSCFLLLHFSLTLTAV